MYNLIDFFDFEFKVLKKFFNKDNYYILKVQVLKHSSNDNLPREMNLKGNFTCVFENDIFEGNGKISVDSYGYFIELSEFPKIKKNQIQTGIAKFLKNIIPRLGIKKANSIVEKLGLDCIDKIINNHEVLLDFRISVDRAKAISEILQNHKRFEELVSFLQTLGINSSIAQNIYDVFKETSIVKIRENPYCLCDIKNMDFVIADNISYKLKITPLNINRIKASIIFLLESKLSNGDLRVTKSYIIDNLNDFTLKYGSYNRNSTISIEQIEDSLSLLTENKVLFNIKDKNEEGILEEYYYLNECYNTEMSIVKNLKRLLCGEKEPFCLKEQIDDFINYYEEKYFKLAEKQKEAVYTALKNSLTILTGKPGTGKTQTTNTIVSCIKKINPKTKIILFAPTGKASRRMEELINMKASTIHKGINIQRFKNFDYEDKIEADFIFIDESSMIDAFVFNKLLLKISEETRIVLIGDYFQLPSVGPGLILRDLIDSKKIPTIELNEIFRQAMNSQITMNAHSVINSKYDDICIDHNKGDFYFIEKQTSEGVRNCIVQCINNLIQNKNYDMKDIIVLSPTKKEICGTQELNRVIQAKFNCSTEFLEYEKEDGTIFKKNDRVINTVNNYDLSVMNGETGIVSKIYSDEGTICLDIEFQDKENIVTFHEKDIEALELSYAITIHKSQGSEFPVVIIPIHKNQMYMLSKNIIYTAMTRGKEVVVFVGQKDTLKKCIEKEDKILRLSGIKNRLIEIL